MKKIAILVLFCAQLLYSFTPLRGDIINLTLSIEGSPYIVEDNLTIKEGNSLTIKQGCILLFNPFTGIIIDGTLLVDGTLEKPVIFTSSNDTSYNSQSQTLPYPFDWNGILIGAKAKRVFLSNFILTYSVYGIKSLKEEFIIDKGTFDRNGQFHVVVNEKIEPAVDGIPFNYGGSYKEEMSLSTQKDTVIITNRRPALLAATGVIAGAGAAASTIVFINVRKNHSKLTNPSEIKRSKTTMITTLAGAATLTITSAVLIPSSIIAKRRHKNSAYSQCLFFIPVCCNGAGVGLVYTF